MTLDEAIKHYEEIAKEKESEAQDLEYSKLDWKHEANQYSKGAKEYRQLAEWLKELKRLKEQKSREEAIAILYQYSLRDMTYPKEDIDAFEIAIKALENEQEQKTGHWIKEKSPDGWDGKSYQCSVCGRSIHLDTVVEDLSDYPYCHCGAKMESEKQI